MERPLISQIVIDGFAKLIDSQDIKGFEKYGKTIDDAKDEEFDWLLMAGEELADMFKYFVKNILQLNRQLIETEEHARKLEHELNGYIVDAEVMEGLLQQANNRLDDAQKEIKHLKILSRVSKCLQLERDNLVLAQENAQLKGLMKV